MFFFEVFKICNGTSGSMYGREDMDEMMGMYDGMHDEDEDDVMGSKSFGSDNAFDETDYPSESSESNIAGSQIEFWKEVFKSRE